MAEKSADVADEGRGRGRPPKVIEQDDLIAAVKRLFADGGIEAVTIEQTANALGVSRARLYRTVPTKQDLLGVLYEDMINQFDREGKAAARKDGRSARDRFEAMVRVQVDTTLLMRDYLFVFFDPSRLPEDVYLSWRRWQGGYERRWRNVVKELDGDDILVRDPVIATRLILGMTIWIAQWYHDEEGISSDAIYDEVLGLLLRPA